LPYIVEACPEAIWTTDPTGLPAGKPPPLNKNQLSGVSLLAGALSMSRRTPWLPEGRLSRRPRFPYQGAGPLLALAAAGALVTIWSLLGPNARPAPPPEKRVEEPAHPPQPKPVPESPPEKPVPPEADACPEGCTSPKPGCDIKGNISIKKKGELIYHLPGQRWYDETVISPEKGERWFCTEEEAEANGWRQAKV
jgi:hypothetical protein